MPYLSADPPLTPRDLFGITGLPGAARPSGGWLPERSLFFGSGRAALWGALHALGVGLGDEVLLPSYLCESVVSPVVARRATPRFFPVGRGLRPDLAALDAAIGPRTRAIVLIHYFGFPGPVEEVRQLCESRGVALIEDCAHALFGRLGDRPLGTFGAAAIYSPWKSLPLPDGGLLALNRAELRVDGPLAASSRAATVRRVAYRSVGSLETLFGWSPRLALLRRNGLRRALHDRTSGAPVDVRAGAPLSRKMLDAAPADQIVARRRENYRRLLKAAARLSWAEPLFDDLPAGVCPLGLPLVAEERDRRRDELLAHGVNVRTYWEHLPVEVGADRFEAAAWLRDRILVLPVHQGLRSDQVDWLAKKLSAIGDQPSAARRRKLAADG
jgi:dTDP-4-amino-4,6-dideoxygalactose transaminase